jgi:drug/metabolite transporter (DMT)-like permease
LSEGNRAWRGYALVVVAAASWAAGGLMAKWLFSPLDAATTAWPVPPPGVEIDPAVLSALRALLAAVILLVYLAIARRDKLKVPVSGLPFLAVFGVLGFAMVHFAYFKAISHTNVATAILLEYLAPVLVLIVSVLFLGERLTWTLPVGVTLSVTGCALFVGAIGGDGLAVSPAGIAWGLAAAAFFAGYSLMGAWASTRYSPWTLLVYGLSFAALFWVVFLGLRTVLAPLADTTVLVTVLVMAVVSTIIPFGAFLAALHYIDLTRALVTSTLEPVIAGVAAFALFGESFSTTQLVGAGLVLAAIVVVQRPVAQHETLPPA